MSLGRTALAAALWLALCGALAGCANLRSSSGKAGAQDAAKPTTPAAERAVYQFEVVAPKELRALLMPTLPAMTLETGSLAFSPSGDQLVALYNDEGYQGCAASGGCTVSQSCLVVWRLR